jgi:hypothetical protein
MSAPRSRAVRFDQSGFTTRSSLQITEVQLTQACSVSAQGSVHGYPDWAEMIDGCGDGRFVAVGVEHLPDLLLLAGQPAFDPAEHLIGQPLLSPQEVSCREAECPVREMTVESPSPWTRAVICCPRQSHTE